MSDRNATLKWDDQKPRDGDVASIERLANGWVVTLHASHLTERRIYHKWEDVLAAITRHGFFMNVGREVLELPDA